MPDWHVVDWQTGRASSGLEGRMPTCVVLAPSAPYLLRLIGIVGGVSLRMVCLILGYGLECKLSGKTGVCFL